MRKALIVAMSRNRVIGNRNELPWHLPADLMRFKSITWGKPLLMGRRTHESLGRPLPGRTNIVLTREPGYKAPRCKIAHSIDEAKRLATGASELMVIGGAKIYEVMLDDADRIYLTLVDAEFTGDTFFPELNHAEWVERSREHHVADARNAYDHTFIVLDRKRTVIARDEAG